MILRVVILTVACFGVGHSVKSQDILKAILPNELGISMIESTGETVWSSFSPGVGFGVYRSRSRRPISFRYGLSFARTNHRPHYFFQGPELPTKDVKLGLNSIIIPIGLDINFSERFSIHGGIYQESFLSKSPDQGTTEKPEANGGYQLGLAWRKAINGNMFKFTLGVRENFDPIYFFRQGDLTNSHGFLRLSWDFSFGDRE